jgi:prolyl-tRNA synthetase
MKEIQKGLKYKKAQFSAWFSELIARADLADMRYNVKGFLVHRPWAVRAMKAMYALYEAELEARGHRPVWFPAVIPETNFKIEAEHVAEFAPEVFWITSAGDGKKLTEKIALRPTSETGMYRMYSIWIRSWRDLPLKLYQSCQVWRYETKATRPFIRGREFWWIEAHNAFATQKEALAQIKEDMAMTEEVMHKQFGIPFIFFKRPIWDKFGGAVDTYAADSLMPDGRIIQQPSTHFLGQNFSKPFEIKFTDSDGKRKLVWQTCYGPCIWRIFASVIAIHGDDKGLIFPFAIAPLQVIIIPILADKAIMEKCLQLKNKLSSHFRVDIDGSDHTAGWKFNEWELRGVPIRLEIGEKELKNGMVTLCRRDSGQRVIFKEDQLIDVIEREGQALTENLKKRADEWFAGMINSAKNMDELKQKAKLGGFIRVPFCSIGEEGRICGEKLKSTLHLHVRGIRVDKEEKPEGRCIVCGKKAGCIVYIGRQY